MLESVTVSHLCYYVNGMLSMPGNENLLTPLIFKFMNAIISIRQERKEFENYEKRTTFKRWR